MKQDWKPEELRATAAEIRGAVMPKSITPEMVGGMLAGLTEAVAEVVETLGEIPREHVRVRVNTLDSEGLTACSTDATVYVDIFTTKGYPAVNMPRKEIKVNGDGIAEFDVPHGFQFAVYAKHPGLSASFQWVHTAAIGERPIIVLWCVPVGVWWFGAIFHGTEDEDMDWGDELYRPVPYLFDHFTDDWDEIEARATPDLRPSENFMDYYNYGIMVATADTCFVIAPNSFSVERMAWSNSRAYGMYIPGMEHINHHTEAGKWQGDYAEAQNRARADMDGNMNTAKILRAVNGALAAEWVGSVVYDYSENRWLPSAGQVYLIWLNRTAINRLMQEAMNSDAETWAYALLPYQNDKGQWQNPNGHYEYWWTSTVFDDSCSWVVNYDGNINLNTATTLTTCGRCRLFILNIKPFSFPLVRSPPLRATGQRESDTGRSPVEKNFVTLQTIKKLTEMANGAATAGAYKSVYRLIQQMVGLSDNVPVKYRRWLWEKTLDAATDLIALIVYAWDEQNVAHKVVYIDRALTKFTVLNTYMRLCNEARVLPLQKQTSLSELMADISGQLGSWRKATAERAKKGV